MFPSFLTSVALLCTVQSVVAQMMTPLYIPGFTSQPLSADVLGVDEQGRTTWAVQAGRTIDGQVRFQGTATLVQGSGFASVTYADPSGAFTLDKSCRLSVGLAFCGTSTGSESAIAVETPILIQVQAGTTTAAIITSPPNPQPTQGGMTATGETPPAQTSSSQRRTPVLHLGATICVWLLAAWPIWM